MPGRTVAPADVTVRAARLGGVDPQTVREVISVRNSDDRQLSIYSAGDGAGNACLGFTAFGIGRAFHCLNEPGFNHQTIIPYVAIGGRKLGLVDRATVIGVARSDVARVVITLVNGSRQDLQLNRWRAFAYAAESPKTMPESLMAYHVNGTVLQVVDVSVSP